MSGRGRLGNSKKVTSMELVELRNGTLILGLRFNHPVRFVSCCLSKEFASPSPPERKLIIFCISGLSVSPRPAKGHAAGWLAGSRSRGSCSYRRAGGRGAGVSSAQRVKRQGRRGEAGGGGRAPGLRAPRPQPAAG